MSYLRLVLFTLLPFVACSSQSSKPQDMQTLRVQLSSEPVSLDPALAEDGLSLRILANVLQGLVAHDGAGGWKYALAESHRASADGKRFEFRLRPGLRWSDGTPIEAQDFVEGIRRSLAPGTASKLAELLLPVRGARAFHSGKSRILPGVTAQDRKLIIELEEPAPYFLQVLALPVAAPIPKMPKTPCNGPYCIAQHVPSRKIVLERNPNYWAATPRIPAIARVELVIVVDENTGVHLFERGQLDILTRVPSMEFERLNKEGVLHTDPFFATYYLSFNTRKPPFNDRDWRRAVAGSIRKGEIVQALMTGEKAAKSWVPQGIGSPQVAVNAEPDFSKSIEKIRALATGTGPIEASFDSSSRNAMILEKIQRDLKKNLGLEVVLVPRDWKSHVKAIELDPSPLFRFGWLAVFPDPISHLQVFTTGNPNNKARWSNPEYDRLVREISRTQPGPARTGKIQRAEKLLVDDEAAVVPIYHYVQNHAVRTRVKRFRVSPYGIIRFDELEIDTDASEK